jgi:hypothetical protein
VYFFRDVHGEWSAVLEILRRVIRAICLIRDEEQ